MRDVTFSRASNKRPDPFFASLRQHDDLVWSPTAQGSRHLFTELARLHHRGQTRGSTDDNTHRSLIEFIFADEMDIQDLGL